MGCRARAAGSPVEIARSYTIDSKTLGERRTIDVTLPDGYARDTAQRYPVIFAKHLDRQLAVVTYSLIRHVRRTPLVPAEMRLE